MATYTYATSEEPVQCVNCGNCEMHHRNQSTSGGMVPYECDHCQYVHWFPEAFAPRQATGSAPDVIAL